MMMLKKIGLLAVVLFMISGCAGRLGNNTMELKENSSRMQVQSDGDAPGKSTEEHHIVPVHKLQNSDFVPLDKLAEAIGFQGSWLSDGSFGVGDHDAAWSFRTGQSAAQASGHEVKMPAPAVKEGNQLFIPVSAIQKLFGDIATFQVRPSEVAFSPKSVSDEGGAATGRNLDFKDLGAADQGQPNELPRFRSMASDNVDQQSLLSFAKKFLGIRYVFGAGDYDRTKTFDCSSFTQYVFAKFGVELPRLARQQGELGKAVDRDQLRTGDLLFFYVPDRFKSDKVVGHVGIYMGNGNMIHASPKPEDGVQITPINKEYWKDTFLFAKRIE